MKLKVSSSNEYKFYPSISGNRELPEGERFTVVLRRINQTLATGKWTLYNSKGGVSLDVSSKIRDHIVRFKNPPIIQIDGKEERELTVDDLLSDKFPELSDIIDEVVNEINDISMTKIDARETKKL